MGLFWILVTLIAFPVFSGESDTTWGTKYPVDKPKTVLPTSPSDESPNDQEIFSLSDEDDDVSTIEAVLWTLKIIGKGILYPFFYIFVPDENNYGASELDRFYQGFGEIGFNYGYFQGDDIIKGAEIGVGYSRRIPILGDLDLKPTLDFKIPITSLNKDFHRDFTLSNGGQGYILDNLESRFMFRSPILLNLDYYPMGRDNSLLYLTFGLGASYGYESGRISRSYYLKNSLDRIDNGILETRSGFDPTLRFGVGRLRSSGFGLKRSKQPDGKGAKSSSVEFVGEVSIYKNTKAVSLPTDFLGSNFSFGFRWIIGI